MTESAGFDEKAVFAAVQAAQPARINDQSPEVDPKARIAVWDALTRNGLAIAIGLAFFLVNAFTLGVLVWLGREDQHDLAVKLIRPADRLVDKDVIIALLGASTVQLGSIAVIMAKYVFKASVDPG